MRNFQVTPRPHGNASLYFRVCFLGLVVAVDLENGQFSRIYLDIYLFYGQFCASFPPHYRHSFREKQFWEVLFALKVSEYLFSPRILKWYYEENRIFPIEAILKHNSSSLYEKKNAVYYFQISLFVPELMKMEFHFMEFMEFYVMYI